MTDQTTPTIQPDQTTPAATRICTACGVELPVDAEHFYRQGGGDGFTSSCRECVKARTRAHKGRLRERKAADADALDRAEAAERALATLLAELPGEPPRLFDFRSRAGRLAFIRQRIELVPPGYVADAANEARRIMHAADAEVRRLCEPPFDVSAVFLLMADGADKDEGIQELGNALRRLGWAP
jgi:hypothetical protein